SWICEAREHHRAPLLTRARVVAQPLWRHAISAEKLSAWSWKKSMRKLLPNGYHKGHSTSRNPTQPHVSRPIEADFFMEKNNVTRTPDPTNLLLRRPPHTRHRRLATHRKRRSQHPLRMGRNPFLVLPNSQTILLGLRGRLLM